MQYGVEQSIYGQGSSYVVAEETGELSVEPCTGCRDTVADDAVYFAILFAPRSIQRVT